MTFSLLLYGSVLGVFLVVAAHFLDLALRTLQRPTRWVWAGALAAGALIPLALFFLPPRLSPEMTPGVALPLEALYRMGWETLPSASGPSPLTLLLDRPLLLLWGLASGAVLILFTGASLRLHRKAAGWKRTRAGDEEVLVSDGVGPAVLGFIRTRIVLPPWALELEQAELEMVLIHEGEHRRARDPALLAGGVLMAALAPWNLPLWWSLRRLRLAVEADCDGRVLARGVRRDRYGSLLVNVASGTKGLSSLAPALMEGGGTFLERRLQMMRDRVRKGSLVGALTGLATGGFFLFLACETPTPPQLSTEVGPQESVAKAAETEAKDVPFGNGLEVSVDGGTASFKVKRGEETEVIRGDKLSVEGSGDYKFRAGEDGSTPQPLIYVDGELLKGGQQALAELDTERIERVEVIKGSAARAIYGDAAQNGVIQIFLKK